jgi:hypothetical protein
MLVELLDDYSLMKDLWNLGRVLEIYTEEDDADCKTMISEVQKAAAADRRSLKENAAGADKVTRIARGEQVEDDSETKNIMIKWLKRIRRDYKGHIIRRTGDSKDNEGKSATAEITMQEHRLVISLYDDEQEHLEFIARSLSKDKPQGGAMFAGGKVRVILECTVRDGRAHAWTKSTCAASVILLWPS